MKKHPGLILLFTFFCLFMMSTSEKTFASLPIDYEYSVSNGEVTITGYTGVSKDISIPEEIDGMVVTRIGDEAFLEDHLTSVIIPNTVTAIGSKAFTGNELTSITIPSSVLTISDRVFTYNQLEEVILEDGLLSIGDFAFSSNQITSIAIPDSVTSLGQGAFFYNQLATVSLSQNLTVLNDSVFMSNKLTSVVIPEHITHINNGSFHGNNLTSVTLQEGVIYIGVNAFNSNALSNVTIPNSVTTIDSDAFSYNTLTNIIIPNSVTMIGNRAFSNNELTSITFPDNLTSIPNGVFQSNHLIDITIPASVTSINDYAFSYNNLSTITFEGSLATLNQNVFDNQMKENHTFENWYSDETRETIWDFSTSIAANTTLYAGYDSHTYSVSFDSNGGSNISDITNVNYDTLISAPEVPKKAGYTFGGWYTAPSFATRWDFNVDKVVANTILFAKWNISGVTYPIFIPEPTPKPTPEPEPEQTPEPTPEPTPVPTQTPVPTFKDIKGHWAEDTIKQAAELGIISGYPDDSFRPNKQMTREEFAVMLSNALKLDSEERSLIFIDSNNIGDWAASAVGHTVEHGIINGYPDGSLRPQANITRAELAVMLANALGEANTDEVSGYVDDAQIPTWAKASITVLKQYGILQGRVGNIFDAQGLTTRAEASTALMKLLALKKINTEN